jgi:hypothetical protein
MALVAGLALLRRPPQPPRPASPAGTTTSQAVEPPAALTSGELAALVDLASERSRRRPEVA